MKKIPYIKPVAVVGLEGALPPKPEADWEQFDFFCGRISDPACVGTREGTEALYFALGIRKELAEQRELAPKRGYWLLEDERADALKRATETPKVPYQIYLALTLEPFCEAVKAMETFKPAEAVKAVSKRA
jgi:hypothetical protein